MRSSTGPCRLGARPWSAGQTGRRLGLIGEALLSCTQSVLRMGGGSGYTVKRRQSSLKPATRDHTLGLASFGSLESSGTCLTHQEAMLCKGLISCARLACCIAMVWSLAIDRLHCMLMLVLCPGHAFDTACIITTWAGRVFEQPSAQVSRPGSVAAAVQKLLHPHAAKSCAGAAGLICRAAWQEAAGQLLVALGLPGIAPVRQVPSQSADVHG